MQMAENMGTVAVVLRGELDHESPLGPALRFPNVVGGNRLSELHERCYREKVDPATVPVDIEFYLPRNGDEILTMCAAFAGQATFKTPTNLNISQKG